MPLSVWGLLASHTGRCGQSSGDIVVLWLVKIPPQASARLAPRGPGTAGCLLTASLLREIHCTTLSLSFYEKLCWSPDVFLFGRA